MRDIIASRGHAHLVAALLLAGGLNLLPQALGLFAFTTRAFLNLDYFLIAAATLLLGPHVLRLAVPAVLALDLLFSLAPAWHFQMGAALQSLADLVLLPAYFWLPIAAVLLAVIFLVSEGVFRLWCNVLPPRSQRRAMAAGAVLALGGGVAMADKILEISDESGWSAGGGGVNLASSGLSDLRIALRTAEAEEAIVLEDAEAASAEITAALGGGSDAPSNVILIVVESWGSGVDQALDALVIEPLVRAADKIPGARLRQGRVPFAGSTVPGEIRELCGRKVLTTRGLARA